MNEDAPTHGKQKVIIYSSRSGGPYKQYLLLRRHLEREGYGVTLYHSALPTFRSLLFERKGMVISLLPLPFRFGARKYILNIKGEYFRERHPWRNPLAYLYPRAIKTADAVVVPSAFLKRSLGLRKATVIPNGIDDVPARPKRAPEPLRIITGTSFAFPIKAEGTLVLLRALAKLRPEQDIIYDIYGDGAFLEDVKRRAQAIMLSPRIAVAFRGHTGRLKEEMLASDLFLYWSEHDNLPNAIIEAMACGLPVVCNDVGAVREIIVRGTQGAIVAEEALPKAIAHLLADAGLRSRMGQEAQVRVRDAFGMERVAALWRGLL